MSKKSLIILFLISIFGKLSAQPEFDNFPKQLQKEVAKELGASATLIDTPMPEFLSKEIFQGKFYTLNNNTPKSTTEYIYIGRVNTCRAGGCTIQIKTENSAPSEFFDYFMLFDSSCTVQMVKIYNYRATHGQEISAKNWLKQFNGYNGHSELVAGKNLDAISGATISVDAITFDVMHKTSLLKQLVLLLF